MKKKTSAQTRTSHQGLWYKDAIIYELHIRAFQDSDKDGMGDFRGLAERLDYLKDLGVSAVWVLPFYPSPWRDDGYDISDYYSIHQAYGTVADFKYFLKEAHRRDLKVITELVLNHTSDQHEWFERSRKASPGSVWRDFYVWSDTPEKYDETRIIFKDFESSNWSWDPVAKAYYWHRFYSHQPDLNVDNPAVWKAMFRVVDFWLKLGVDGLRLDAVPYLYEREDTNCENLPETYAFLKKLRSHIDNKFLDRMLLAEANQWPEDSVAYFGNGDMCQMAFHFPLMPRMFMAVRMEDRYPILDILDQTPAIPDNSQWALFLRNHDELTLEMVTDEERDYMYQMYTQDTRARINLGIRHRLAPLLRNDRRKIELMNILLFSLPGTPVLYYGDEIGMGDNIYLGDRNGVRTPMQWSADRNAGFSQANAQQLFLPVIIDPEYHYESCNVDAGQKNPSSLLWFTKRLIALRKRFKAFGRGTIEFLHPENRKILAFVRRYEDEVILVIANLSRVSECVWLDLNEFREMIPVELFGGQSFPIIQNAPYLMTLGPHGYYWLALKPQPQEGVEISSAKDKQDFPVLQLTGSWESMFKAKGKAKGALERLLRGFLLRSHWFGEIAERIKSTRLIDAVPVAHGSSKSYISLIEAEYADGGTHTWVLPLTYSSGGQARKLEKDFAEGIIARVLPAGGKPKGLLVEAVLDGRFCNSLLQAIAGRQRFAGLKGEIHALPTKAFASGKGHWQPSRDPVPVRAEHRNMSIYYGNRWVLKLFRRLGEGLNPDYEIRAFLSENQSFSHIPLSAGALEYRQKRKEPITLAILQQFVPNRGSAWQYTVEALGRYFERVLARPREFGEAELPSTHILEQRTEEMPAIVPEVVGTYLETARQLGQITGELHLALAATEADPRFAPEPYTSLSQRSLYQSMRNLTNQVLYHLRKRLKDFPETLKSDAKKVLESKGQILECFQSILNRKISARRIRLHGDYHLGQLLYTGKSFVAIDFEGDPARPLSDRRRKRSAFRDVAGMLRSFDNAAHTALHGLVERGVTRQEDLQILYPWARFWHFWVSAAFVDSYLTTASHGTFLPKSNPELRLLFDFYLLEKLLSELEHDLHLQPDSTSVALTAILRVLGIQSRKGEPDK